MRWGVLMNFVPGKRASTLGKTHKKLTGSTCKPHDLDPNYTVYFHPVVSEPLEMSAPNVPAWQL